MRKEEIRSRLLLAFAVVGLLSLPSTAAFSIPPISSPAFTSLSSSPSSPPPPDDVPSDGVDSAIEGLLSRVSAMRASSPDVVPNPSRVYAVFFNPDAADSGVHTVRVGGVDVLLAFEARMDCRRFALSLEAQGFKNPVVTELGFEEVRGFCEGQNGVEYQVVEEGTVLVPPEGNVEGVDVGQGRGKEGGGGGDAELLRRSMEDSFTVTGEGDEDGFQ